MYPGGSAFIPWLLIPGFMPRGGERGQNLWQLFLKVFYFSVMKTTYAESWSDIGGPCDINLTLSEGQHDLFMVQWFCLIYLDYLMYEHHSLGLWVSMTRGSTSKVNISHCDLYFMVQWFCLKSKSLFDVWTSYFGFMSQYDMIFDLKTRAATIQLPDDTIRIAIFASQYDTYYDYTINYHKHEHW